MRISLAFAAIAAAALVSTAALADTLDCPTGPATPEPLEAFRLSAATALNAGTLGESDVSTKITACFPAQVPACLQRMMDYATREDIASASQDVTAAASPQKRPPDEILLPGTTGLEYTIPEAIEAIAAEKGWTAVRYKSRHAGGFDAETPSLLMVYVPGDKVSPPVTYDRWLNFAIPADLGAEALNPSPQAPVPGAADYAAELAGGPALPRTFTMVTLEKKQGATPGKVFFQKFYRGQSGSPAFVPEFNSAAESCVSCHPNGLRAISPLGFHVRAGEAQLSETAWLAVKLMNDAMDEGAGNKMVTWREANGKLLYKPMAQGPVIGPKVPLSGGATRTKEFIAGCLNTRPTVYVTDIFGRDPGKKNVFKLAAVPSVRWEKVADAMKCETCHNNKQRGALSEATDFSQIDFKILVDQSMPLGLHNNPLEQENGTQATPVQDELTPDERIALSNCLRAEFDVERGKLVKWLTQTSCQ